LLLENEKKERLLNLSLRKRRSNSLFGKSPFPVLGGRKKRKEEEEECPSIFISKMRKKRGEKK